nr:MAG TPA: hypothetical protein [Caudoviricetes sp.]
MTKPPRPPRSGGFVMLSQGKIKTPYCFPPSYRPDLTLTEKKLKNFQKYPDNRLTN